ncbi:SagB family peptide dehydrogenase [Bacillus sp. FSL W7-1360]
MDIKVSECVVFFYKDGHYICDNYLDHIQKSLNPSVAPIIQFFSEWKDKDLVYELTNEKGNSREFLTYAIDALIECNVLIKRNSPAHEFEKKISSWNVWGTSFKYFHCSTRLIKNDKFNNKEQQYKRLKERKGINPQPSLFKSIEGVKRIDLPVPDFRNKKDFLYTLLDRQTIRELDNSKSLTLQELSTILFLVYGAQACKRNIGVDHFIFKTSPSGGSRHPVEVYPCVINVEGIESGIYHYNVEEHSLELIDNGILNDKYVDMAAHQEYIKNASVLFFYTAYLERTMWKYLSPRAYRVIMMDLGHLSQTLYLTANWMGLGAFFTAHLKDELVEEKLHLDHSNEVVLGLSGIGHLSAESIEHGRNLRLLGELNENQT